MADEQTGVGGGEGEGDKTGADAGPAGVVGDCNPADSGGGGGEVY